ncbi:MAG: hypothetical protein HZC54_06175 [Verrucomicrobia bacterium]|nr:hypothetical protein [Verrucomicrobiota bacterium]
MARHLRVWLALLLLAPLASAKPEEERREVQRHGYVFEKWVRDTFFGGYTLLDYTQKWDIPKEVNKLHGGLPCNMKAIKYGSSVDMGDALRQFQVDEPFILIIAFWQQESGQKRIVNILAPTVTPALYRKLWAPITLEDLKRLDAVVKDRHLSYREARAAAQKIKSAPPFTRAIITVNPKIDEKGQRRLQCSLSFKKFFEHLAPQADPKPQREPRLFGVSAPGPFLSAPRSFSNQ